MATPTQPTFSEKLITLSSAVSLCGWLLLAAKLYAPHVAGPLGPVDPIKPPKPPAPVVSAIAESVESMQLVTADEYADAFDATAADVRAGKITHARELLEAHNKRIRVARDTGRVPFDTQWAKEMPTGEISKDTAAEVAAKLEEYARAWRRMAASKPGPHIPTPRFFEAL